MDVECCRHVLNQYLRQIAQSHCRDFEVIAIARDLLNSWLAHRHLQALAQSVNFFGGSPASGLSERLGGGILALTSKPFGYSSKKDVRHQGSDRERCGGRRRRAEEYVALNRKHHNPENERPNPTNGIDGRGPLEVQDHSPEKENCLNRKGDNRMVPEPKANLHRIVIERQVRPMNQKVQNPMRENGGSDPDC